MVSPQERRLLLFVRNFSRRLTDFRLGMNSEAALCWMRSVPLPVGKNAEAVCDPRQKAALDRARADLSLLVGSDWRTLDDFQRQEALRVALG